MLQTHIGIVWAVCLSARGRSLCSTYRLLEAIGEPGSIRYRANVVSHRTLYILCIYPVILIRTRKKEHDPFDPFRDNNLKYSNLHKTDLRLKGSKGQKGHVFCLVIVGL